VLLWNSFSVAAAAKTGWQLSGATTEKPSSRALKTLQSQGIKYALRTIAY